MFLPNFEGTPRYMTVTLIKDGDDSLVVSQLKVLVGPFYYQCGEFRIWADHEAAVQCSIKYPDY